MRKITLISPYFGKKFPSTFPALLDSMRHNPEVTFIIPTNVEFNVTESTNNVIFIKTDLLDLNKEIDAILGYHATIKSAYKLVDFRPMYGKLFSKYILNSTWWGYFDFDIIFGNISRFLTDAFLENYDRIYTHGHLTLFRNNEYMNTLWNKKFDLPEIPSFKEVATNQTVFAFDEWGWGKNRGRGLSYALNYENNIRQYDNNEWFADLVKDEFTFNTTSGRSILFFTYDKGNLIGFDKNNVKSNYLYVHFQKRSIVNRNCTFSAPVYITPNIMSNVKEDNTDELKRWKNDQRKRKYAQKKANLNFSYLKRRLKFMGTEH